MDQSRRLPELTNKQLVTEFIEENPTVMDRSIAGICRQLRKHVDLPFTCIRVESDGKPKCKFRTRNRKALVRHLCHTKGHVVSLKSLKAEKKKLDEAENPSPERKLILALKVRLLIVVNGAREDDILSYFEDDDDDTRD